EVASHTVAMILTLDRGLVAYDRALRAGTWAPTAQHAARLSSTVVAVIGYGRIGSEVARSARALGYRVLVHDPFVDPQAVASDGHEAVGIDEAVARADVITLHAPLTESTRHLLDARTLAAAKPGVRVVNTCRGPLIDEDALADALASGHVGSAALDVYATEPLPADSRLRALDNVLLTPHAAWFSPEAMQDLPVHTARNAVDFLAGRPVPSIVNPDHARALA
ncbi:MAG: NAD(P)-dependent oxidoreductase, partial [Cellulosimicrobium funkei]